MKRTILPENGYRADANILPLHPADAASWIWHPSIPAGQTAFLRFTLSFELETATTLPLHVTADQRYQLTLDGREIGFGPDRSPVHHWSVATYDVSLQPGTHQLEALVWWIADETMTGLRTDPKYSDGRKRLTPPIAQMSWRGGFLLGTTEAGFRSHINTGEADWKVTNLTPAVEAVSQNFYAYHDIGPEFHIKGDHWNAPESALSAISVAASVSGNLHGVQRPGWKLAPASMAEQRRERFVKGKPRALYSGKATERVPEDAEPDTAEAENWTALFRGERELEIQPHTNQILIWDFETYVCGYAGIATTGGKGASVRIDWVESLHVADSFASITNTTPKGHRSEIAGKFFNGFGDVFKPDGNPTRFPTLWWRSGRYLRVHIVTADEALILNQLEVRETGYPLGDAAPVSCDQEDLNEVLDLSVHGLRMNGHEVWTDCPYYEQEAYVGDNRLTALCNYAMFEDDRLSRRMIQLFDLSRVNNGLVAERYPSGWEQVSTTYSLIWVWMVRDYAWWRDDPAFVSQCLRGVRAMIDELWDIRTQDGLLGVVPGWPFVDWVTTWNEGCGPGVREGDSSIVNLHLLLALRAAAELESHFGEKELANLQERRAASLETAIIGKYWSAERNLIADTSKHDAFSEHAQSLAVLAGVTVPGEKDAWTNAWLDSGDLAPATIYFSYYPMDALWQLDQGEALHSYTRLWRDIPKVGLCSLPEQPEPTRSDCHGWGAHLRYHAAASFAGIRPAEPGFKSVQIRPVPGPLKEVKATVFHPQGSVAVAFQIEGDSLKGSVELPEGIAGTVDWRGQHHKLPEGGGTIDL